MDLPIRPLREITYRGVQRHRAHVHQTMRDASKMVPVDFVDLFDAGVYAKEKKNKTAHRKCPGELQAAQET